MTTKTTSIYIEIAKVQAKRRENWLPGYPIDRDLEHAHQFDLAILREKLEATTQENIVADIHVPKEKFSMISLINHFFKTLYQPFTRKSL